MTETRTEPAGYRALLRAVPPGTVLHEVVQLHRPKPFGTSWWECGGCDPGMNAESDAEWPCATVELIAQRSNVELRAEMHVIEGSAG